MEMQDPMNPSGRFHMHAAVGPKGTRPEILELEIDLPAEPKGQPSKLGLGAGIVLNFVKSHTPSLRRISAAGMPLTRPARTSATRRFSSAITFGG